MLAAKTVRHKKCLGFGYSSAAACVATPEISLRLGMLFENGEGRR
jgi:hypothetical protein